MRDFFKPYLTTVGHEDTRGQEPDFRRTRQKLLDKKRLDLISRFSLQAKYFKALIEFEDFERLLQQVDETPCGKKMDATSLEALLPLAYGAGFRLKTHAPQMFELLHKSMAIDDGDVEIPLRQLFAAFRIYLLDAHLCDSSEFTFDPKGWRDAIRRAAISEAALLADRGEEPDWVAKG